jgi:hypothetical protein
MVRRVPSLIAAVLVSSLVLLLCLPLAKCQTLAVGTLSGFESPGSLSNGNYMYVPPVTVLQPWIWTPSQGGIGASGGPFDPPYPGTPNDSPPSPNQYAFIQTSPNNAVNMQVSNVSCTLSGLTSGSSYNLTFWYAARSNGYTGNATQSQLTVYLAGTQLWQSVPAILDISGWAFTSVIFTASSSSGLLLFNVVSGSNNDRSILLDSVLVMPTGSQLLTAGSVAANTALAFSFEAPILNGSYYGPGVTIQTYSYNPPLSSSQPWAFTYNQGGIAFTGSPWDPPSPAAPPSGSQYAFLQVSPHSVAGEASSNMSTTVTGLTAGSQYSVSYYWATRAGYGQTSQLTIWANGVVISQSQKNVSDSSGWQYNSTAAFTASGSSCLLLFQVQSLSNSDGAVLIDAVTVGPPFPTPAYSLAIGTVYGFESPGSLANGNYGYGPPMTVLQPWSWTPGQGGIGASGGPFDPPYPGTPNDSPPSPNQYAFIQTSPNNAVGMRTSSLTSALTGLLGGLSYTISFYYAARSQGYTGNATQSQMTLYLGAQQIWQSPAAILDLSGWTYVSQTFAPVSSSANLTFAVVSSSDNDRSILVDTVVVAPTTMPLLTSGSLTTASTAALSFETPSLNPTSYPGVTSIQSYLYSPQITASQPWTFTPYQGGIAITGSPWDPPSPITPPNGVQYAFLQTSPHSAINDRYSIMTTTVTGLSFGYPYAISFYWGTRNGYSDTSQLSVIVNGITLFVSQNNLTDAAGWNYNQTAAFAAASTTAVLQFAVISATNSDGAVLIDNIQFFSPPTALPLYNFSVGTPAYFESPVIGSYLYNPGLSPLQPWVFTVNQGGIGYSGGPFDPPYPGTPNNDPPSANQYAFIQTSPNNAVGMRSSNMSAALIGLTPQTSYILTFYYAARSNGYTGNGTQSQLMVYLAGQMLWQSPPAIQDLSGWAFVSQTFTASVSSGVLTFAVVSTSDNDRSIDVDSVLVMPASSPAPTSGSLTTTSNSASTALSFESPILNGSYYGAGVSLQNYAYNPLITAQQPWAFTPFQGGIALTGSPWDPPVPVPPPNGAQYAFLQTSPHNALNDGTSNMSTTVTGLTAGSYYAISFYWGTRAGYATTSQLTVYVNNAIIFTSNSNLSDPGGWKTNTTTAFLAPAGSFTLLFRAVSLTNSDGALLLDYISFTPSSAPPPPPPTPSSSSSVPVAVVTSSSSSAAGPAVSVPSSSSSSSGSAQSGGGGGGGSGLSGGAIAGIVIGSVVGGCLLCALLVFCLTNRNKRTKKSTEHDRESRGAGNFDEVNEQSVNQGEGGVEMTTH